MPITPDSTTVSLPTSAIIIGERQRSDSPTLDLQDSISRLGVLHPILITRANVLVAGFRRLKACEALKLNIPCRYYDTLSSQEAEIVELEENLKRVDLPWQDQVRAIIKIHTVYRQLTPGWTQENTAERIGLDQTTISEMLTLEPYMESPNVLAASGWKPASNAIRRVNARKTDVVMTSIIENSTKAFASPEKLIIDIANEKTTFANSIFQAR